MPVSIGRLMRLEAARGFVVGRVLRRFRMMTDYRRDALYLIGDAQALSLPFEKDRSGLRLEAAGRGPRPLRPRLAAPPTRQGLEGGRHDCRRRRQTYLDSRRNLRPHGAVGRRRRPDHSLTSARRLRA